ncbi:MAG: hypothetical protein BWZ10_00240 [candidate division BRC1 bacterium ADurb.BinA364]|nr:MAG: hypothetical protein BWZ10_00240 [candidate division BRC1 bacterium ADurb.BinA364]
MAAWLATSGTLGRSAFQLGVLERGLQLSLDDDRERKRLEALNAEVDERLREAQARLDDLLEGLGDWPRRGDLPQALKDELGEFFALARQGLAALQQQIGQREQDLHERRKELADSIRGLKQNRQGVRQYRSGPKGPKMFDSKA